MAKLTCYTTHMKLVLANNHTQQFTDFYTQLQHKSGDTFRYGAYVDLLFLLGISEDTAVEVYDVALGAWLHEYDGVYINGYLNTYELAVAVATCCEANGVPFVNQELKGAPSLSKLTGYAKLASAGVPIPPTITGTKSAILRAPAELRDGVQFPAVLKRADADRGIDNYKVKSYAEVQELLESHEATSLWVLQSYIENQGYYLVTFYDSTPAYGIYRSLETRPDGDELKAHMYKPKGGANASLLEVKDIPTAVVKTSQQAIKAMNRQIGSVDCLYDAATGATHILEVNYNPQLVTIETFKDIRRQSFIEGIQKI